MEAHPDCRVCFELQALRTARLITASESEARKIVEAVKDFVAGVSLEATPPEIGHKVHRLITRMTGVRDPYRNVKKKCNDQALALYPGLHRRVRSSRDGLLAAIKLAIAGNVIDFGADREFDWKMDLERITRQGLAINDYSVLREALRSARNILYLADNAGETVFDRLLIEEMDRPVIYAVKAEPIINDATRRDAERSDIGRLARIISSGSSMPGTLLRRCTPRFLQVFRSADLIISKGQGNYETLSEEKAPLFFLLKAKCAVVARHLNVKRGSLLLVRSRVS